MILLTRKATAERIGNLGCSDDSSNAIFIQRTYGKLLLAVELLMVSALQFGVVADHFYAQAACLVVGMVFVKLAHLATQAGISKAARIEHAIKQKNRAEDGHQQKIASVLRRAAVARIVAQSSIFGSTLKAIAAAELHVRSLVKSVLCAVTETITPRLFPCPPTACA